MQVGVNHYVSNQHLGQAQAQSAQQASGAPQSNASGPDAVGLWQEDRVSWSDRLYELHDMASTVRLDAVNFREVGELRQALYERGWISSEQAVALTELGARLSDRLSYRMDDILAERMQADPSAQRALGPVLAAVQNILAVQSLRTTLVA